MGKCWSQFKTFYGLSEDWYFPNSGRKKWFFGGHFLFSSHALTYGDFQCVRRMPDGSRVVVKQGVFPNKNFAPFITPDETLDDPDCQRVGIRRYMHNVSCYWHFRPPPGHYILYRFVTFKLDLDCESDYVHVQSTGSTTPGSLTFDRILCGRQQSSGYRIVPTDGLNISFTSDGQYSCRGFAGFFFGFQPLGKSRSRKKGSRFAMCSGV